MSDIYTLSIMEECRVEHIAIDISVDQLTVNNFQ